MVLNTVTIQDDQMEVGNEGKQTSSDATTDNDKNMQEELPSDATTDNDPDMQVTEDQILQIKSCRTK